MNYLPVLFGYHATGLGNSHVPLSLCTYWEQSGRPVRLYVPSAESDLSQPWLIPVMGGIRKKLVYRFAADAAPGRITEKYFLARENNAPTLYLWAGLSLEIFEECKQAGARIIIERINCHQASTLRILEAAADRYGFPAPAGYTPQDIARENRKLELCDAVFCPSPMVRASMLENKVPEHKLLSTSYGWAPERFPRRQDPVPINGRPVFLFVGTLCLRKGIPLLLQAWEKADLDAELILCGGMDPEFSDYLTPRLQGKNITYVPYTTDIGQLFKQADIFVFPTLEEGGPMVTYEAMAHAIPPLVTAMGAGAVVEDGINGCVLPDDDPLAWAQAMTRMLEDKNLRIQLGERARDRAELFTWENVAARRARLLEEKFPGLWQDPSTKNPGDHRP